MIEAANELPCPERFWAMMEQIGNDSKASGYIPRSVEQVETERQAFRDEWDERQDAQERTHLEGERLRSEIMFR